MIAVSSYQHWKGPKFPTMYIEFLCCCLNQEPSGIGTHRLCLKFLPTICYAALFKNFTHYALINAQYLPIMLNALFLSYHALLKNLYALAK